MRSTNSRGRGRALASMCAIGAITIALGSAGSAFAAGGTHTQTFTDNFHGSGTSVGMNPCTGDPIDLAQSTNQVDHVTFFPASDELWATFTEEDKFTGVDQGTGVLYSGHATFWGNFNLNRQNSNQTFTATIRATGSDGSTIAFHDVMHITMLPDGNVSVSFDRPSVTCG